MRINDLRRVVAVLLQVVFPGCIGAFLAYLMAGTMFGLGSSRPLLPFVFFAGPVVGFVTWLFGLIADRASGERLLLTIIYATLGFLMSYSVIVFSDWPSHPAGAAQPPEWTLAIAVAVGAPLAGAMAGYYWAWRKPGR
jgi:hypothetical protein